MGKIEPEVSDFKSLFWGGTEVDNSYKHVFGREFKGRDIAFVSDWLTKKGLQK